MASLEPHDGGSGQVSTAAQEEAHVVDKLNTWLSVLANLGVVVGIFFLIVEIRQNTEALRAETHLAMFQGAQQELFVTVEHPDLVAIVADAGTPATFEDMARMDSFLAAAMNARQYAWRQWRSGVLDEESWEGERNIIALLLGSERTRHWWERLGRVQFSPSFAALVDEIVAGQPEHPYWEALRALHETASESSSGGVESPGESDSLR